MKLKNSIFISIGVVFLFSLLLFVGFFSNINLKLSDNLYGGKNALDGIAIIGIDDVSMQEIGRWPWNRETFAEIIPLLNKSRVIGIDITFSEGSDKGNDSLFAESLKEANVVLASEFISFNYDGGEVRGDWLLTPLNDFSYARTGYINVITDKDSVTRAVNLGLSEQEKSFSEVLYEEYWKKELKRDDSRLLINFVGNPGSFNHYSFIEVINGSVDLGVFENKLVLIGATSPDLRDTAFVPTSSGKAMNGVEIHANTLQTLIKQDYLQEQSKLSVIILMFLFSLVLVLIFHKTNILWAGLISPALILTYLLIVIFFFNRGLIMNILYVPLVVLFTFGAETTHLYFTERKSKLQLRGAFSKYVSPSIVEEVIKNPDTLKLGGTRKEITVFFSDIRGFTTISEKLKPEKLVHLMNEYLTAMTDIIMKHEGVVDKYIGDAIMAFWGAPLENKNHAIKACETSLDMIKELEELRTKWKREGLPEIRIGIGLSTGEAVIGNMGSYNRFDYTAMGDTINIGARLESLTKEKGVQIIISEKTKKAVNKIFKTRKLGKVKVKGKNKAIVVYELIGKK